MATIQDLFNDMEAATAAGEKDKAQRLAQLIGEIQGVPQEAQNAPQAHGGFLAAAKAGFSDLQRDAARVAGRTGAMDSAKAEAYAQEQDAKAKQQFIRESKGWGTTPWQEFKELLGGSLPYMAAPIAVGAAAAAAAPVGIAGLVGAGTAGLTSMGQFTGSNITRQMETGKKLDETSLGNAALAAAPQAALDMIGISKIPGLRQLIGLVAKDVGPEAAKAIAAQTFKEALGSYAKATGKAMGYEGVTEAGQQVLERLQAGLEINNPEARKEYWDSFVGGVVLGGALSPVGHRMERGQQARAEDKKATKDAEDKAAADAATAADAAAKLEGAKSTPEYAATFIKEHEALKQERTVLQKTLSDNKTKKSDEDYHEKAAANKETGARLGEVNALLKEQTAEYVAHKKNAPAAEAEASEAPEAPKSQDTDLFGNTVEQKDTTDVLANEQERKGYGPESRAADMEAALEGPKDPQTRLGELQQQIRMLGGMEEGAGKERKLIPGLLQEHQEAAKAAEESNDPQAMLKAARQMATTQKAHDTALSEFHALYAEQKRAGRLVAPAAPSVMSAYKRAMTNAKKALNDGNWELAAKQSEKAAGLKEAADKATTEHTRQKDIFKQHKLPAKAQSTQQEGTDQWITPKGSESAEDFNARSTPELPNIGVAAPEAPSNMLNTERTDQLRLDIAPPLETRTIQGVGGGNWDLADAVRARATAVAMKDKFGVREATARIKDITEREVASKSSPDGEMTTGLTESPESVTAKQKTADEQHKALTDFMIKPTPENRGNVLETMSAELGSVSGDKQTESKKWAFANEAGPILDKYATGPKTLTNHRAAMQALKGLRERLLAKPATSVDTSYATEHTAPEDITRQIEPMLAKHDLPQATRDQLIHLTDSEASWDGPTKADFRADISEWLHRGANTADWAPIAAQIKQSQSMGRSDGAQQEFPQTHKESLQGHVFQTREEFESYLRSEALHKLRTGDKEHNVAQTISRAQERIAPLQAAAAALKQSLGWLQTMYEAAKKVHAGNIANADAAIERAEAKLAGIQAKLEAELAPFRSALASIDAAWKFESDTATDISNRIASNLLAYAGPEAKAYEQMAAGKRAVQKALAKPVEKANWDSLRGLQKQVVKDTQAWLIADTHRSEALTAYVRTDMRLQTELADQVSRMVALHNQYDLAETALREAQALQKKRVLLKRDRPAAQSEVDNAKNARVGTEAIGTADIKKRVGEIADKTQGSPSSTYAAMLAAKRSLEIIGSAHDTPGHVERVAAAQDRYNAAKKTWQEEARAKTDKGLPEDGLEALMAQIEAELKPVEAASSKRTTLVEDSAQSRATTSSAARSAERQAEQTLRENLDKLPGTKITHEAYRNALDKIEEAPARIAELQANVARFQAEYDAKLQLPGAKRGSKTSLNDAKRQLLAYEALMKEATKLLSTVPEARAAAHEALQDMQTQLKERVDAQKALVAEKDTPSRREELKRRASELRAVTKLVNALSATSAEKKPILSPKDKQAEREDRSAYDTLEKGTALAVDGETGAITPRIVGPLMRDTRGGALRSAGVPSVPARTKIVQTGHRKSVTSKQAQVEANRVTETARIESDIEKIATNRIEVENRLEAAMDTGNEVGIEKYSSFLERMDRAAEILEGNLEALRPRSGSEKALALGPVVTGAGDAKGAPAKYAMSKKREKALDSGDRADALDERTEKSAQKGADATKPTSADIAEGVASRERYLEKALPGIGFDRTSPWHGKTYAEAALLAAANPHSADAGVILKHLAELLKTAPSTDMHGRVYVMSAMGRKTGRVSRNPHYDPTMDYVLVMGDGLATNLGFPDTYILAHELGHVATTRGILLSTPEAAKLRDDLGGVLRTVMAWTHTAKGKQYLLATESSYETSTHYGVDGKLLPYGLKNVGEMLAELHVNADFRDLLAQVRTGTAKPNMLTRAINAIADFLGFKVPKYRSALHDIIELKEAANKETLRTHADSDLWKYSKHKTALSGDTELSIGKPAAPMNDAEKFGRGIRTSASTLRTAIDNKSKAGLLMEQKFVDMRASVRAVLKMGSAKTGTQAQYFVRQADDIISLSNAVASKGALGFSVDKKGLRTVTAGHSKSLEDTFKTVGFMPLASTESKMAVFQGGLTALRAIDVGWDKLNFSDPVQAEKDGKAALRAIAADPALQKAFDAARDVYRDYNHGQIKSLIDSHAVSAEHGASMLADKNYIPMFRSNGDSITMIMPDGHPMSIGDIRSQPYLASLVGGDKALMKFEDAAFKNTAMLTNMAMHNISTTQLAYHLQSLGKSAGVMQIKPGKGTHGSAETIQFRQKPDPNKPNDDGWRHLVIDTKGTVAEHIPTELLAQSVAGSYATFPSFVNVAGMAGDILRAGVTRSPLYALRQVYKDSVSASMLGNLKRSPVMAALESMRIFGHIMAGNSAEAKLLASHGVGHSNVFNGTKSDMRKSAAQLVGTPKTMLGHAAAFMDKMAMAADASVRVQHYNDAIEAGSSEAEAVLSAREIQNFAKHGSDSSVQFFARTIPFFNASIQGLNVMQKAFKGDLPSSEVLKSKEAFYRRAMSMTAMAVTYAMLMEDDPDWQKMSLRDKVNFIHVPKYLTGTDEAMRLPAPFEVGMAFYSLPVAMVEAMREDFTASDWKTIREVFTAQAPGGGSLMPQIAKGFYDVSRNYNSGLGIPIETAGMTNLSKEARFNARTTEAAKAFSKHLVDMGVPLSPVQLEYLSNAYLGGLPLAVAAMTNAALADATKGERITKHMSEEPFVGSFYQNEKGTEYVSKMYDRAKEATEAKSTFDQYRKQGDLVAAKEFLQAHRTDIALEPVSAAYKKAMGELRLKENQILNHGGLSGDEKQARVDQIIALRSQRSKQFNDVMQRITQRTEQATSG